NNKNAKLVVRLAKKLSDLENITFNSKDKTNPMKIDGDAKTIENIKKMTFGPSKSTDSITVDGEQKVITGLSNTKLPTDLTKMKADQAASQGQLKEVLDKATATDDFSVKYDKKDTGEVDKNSITLEGGDAGTVIKNVANGKVAADSKEAINGSQLHEVKNNLTNEINTTNQNVTNVTNNLGKTNKGFDVYIKENTDTNKFNVGLGADDKDAFGFDAGNGLEISKNGKKITYALKDDIEVGKEGQPGQAGKDGKVTVNGKDGEKVTIDGKDGKIESKAKDGTTVTVNGKDGTIGAQGPKGADGKDGASVTINGKDGTTIINGATDENGKKNTITLNGKDGTMGVDGKDGNSVTLNGQDGSIGMKGKDGTNAVSITTQNGKVGVDGKDGETRLVVKEGTKTHELATMNDGMQFAGDIGAENKLKL
ncbi:hypothetical protein C3L56_06315, partial [Veillonellaceae bacterium M2-4]|nr:hypothetical protein [Veillonellaceae bacterium M2-4]